VQRSHKLVILFIFIFFRHLDPFLGCLSDDRHSSRLAGTTKMVDGKEVGRVVNN
jgi:hypothetical protein